MSEALAEGHMPSGKVAQALFAWFLNNAERQERFADRVPKEWLGNPLRDWKQIYSGSMKAYGRR